VEGAGVFGDVLNAIPGKVIDWVGDWIKDKLATMAAPAGGTYSASAGAQQWAGLAAQVLAMYNLPATLLPLMLHRIDVESGGNPNAINLWDSNAAAGIPSMGLMQTIGPTFYAYAGQYASLGPYNPLANMYAAVGYTLARYGLSGIYGAWGGTLGYDSGGMLPTGLSLTNNQTGTPEPVLTSGQWDNLSRAATQQPDIDWSKLTLVLAAALTDALNAVLDGRELELDGSGLYDTIMVRLGRSLERAL